jgi:hypothetical protein
MARQYRVVHQRKSTWEALVSGRGYRDWYLAQVKRLWRWSTLGTFPTVAEAEAACQEHAGGVLLSGGGRVVAEFERPD